MRKLLLILVMLLILPVFADTMPYYTNAIPKNVIGVYQTGEKLTVFSHPETNSRIVKTFDFSYNPENKIGRARLNSSHIATSRMPSSA